MKSSKKTKNNQHNFDWSVTDRDIVIYVPNFRRKNLLAQALQRYKTALPNTYWMMLVVNDGPHEDLSDLQEQYNLRWFTFERPDNERNGCMIRNHIIRNVRSSVLCTRDPEIYFEGEDYLVRVFEALEKDIVYRPGSMTELDQHGGRVRTWKVDNLRYECLHAGVAIRTERLLTIGGYDEQFRNYYGFEDAHMLSRLRASGVEFVIDDEVKTFHLYHDRPGFQKSTAIAGQELYNKKVMNLEIVANKGEEWGQGL